jgi:methyltransferase family protein
MADNGDARSLSYRLRKERFRRFAAMLRNVAREPRILDVGGTPEFWVKHRSEIPTAEITLVNLTFGERANMPGISCVTGDARHLEMFKDAEFDLCFSNSVIEHVGTFQDQWSMAHEIRRVAKGYFVQTPNARFPVEPHFQALGWQFAPVALRTRLLQRRDWGWMKRVQDPILARATVESIRLLSARELRCLFPDGAIYREKIGPLTKSIIASRPVR